METKSAKTIKKIPAPKTLQAADLIQRAATNMYQQ
jgi:hypothetical protein